MAEHGGLLSMESRNTVNFNKNTAERLEGKFPNKPKRTNLQLKPFHFPNYKLFHETISKMILVIP